MSAATIIFTDLVNFSRKPTAEQRRLVESLTSEIIHELRTLLFPPISSPNLIALPTGDGLALAFLHEVNHPWNFNTILSLILRLHRWAHIQSTPENFVGLRVGVHVGSVELITDINGKTNVCGDTINYTQRVMDAASPRQTLFSDAAFREYVGAESPICNAHPSSERLKAEFKGPIEVYAKHGLQILVYKLILNPLQEYWENEDPIAKHLMLVTLTPLPKEIVGTFSDRIQKAKQIAFIQLTGDRFIERYHNGEISFSEHLNRFWVFMPDPEIYKNYHLTKPQAKVELVVNCIDKWRDLFDRLKVKYPHATLKLGLFKEPPYFGASFIDWERPEGRIHVSPYIWDVAAPECPGYDLEWIGKKPSNIYETYVKGLRYLDNITKNELTN